MQKKIGTYYYGDNSSPRNVTVLPAGTKTFHNSLFIYGEKSQPATGLLLDEAHIPVIVWGQEPDGLPYKNSKSLQPRFFMQVTQNNQPAPTAVLYYRYYALPAPQSLPGYVYVGTVGTGRYLPAFTVIEGTYRMEVTATLPGVSPAVDHYDWTVDVTSPTIEYIQPINNSESIGVTAQVQIRFSENMRSAPILSGNAITITPAVVGAWAGANRDFTFTPSSPMVYNTLYEIRVSTAAQDLAGNGLSSAVLSVFRTTPKLNVKPDAPTFNNTINVTSTSSGRPRLVFNVPNDDDNDNLHFVVDVSSTQDFSGDGYSRTYNSVDHPAAFTHFTPNGTKTAPFPANGVLPNSGKVVFKIPATDELQSRKYWLRVFANDLR
jgi:hypothetical protein